MRTAVVLFNLGGPDGPEAVQPFLFNLFNDPAILGVPNLIRPWLAKLISSRRAPEAQKIYAELGGGSPLLPNTQAQADALTAALDDIGEIRTFIAMRYWHPFSGETARAVKDFAPDRIVLLPLYPQFSTTTSGSSLADWHRAARAVGIDAPAKAVCCYPAMDGFIEALTELTRAGIAKAKSDAPDKPVRVLFTAHGLPEKIVKKGDPYADHVGRTVAPVVERLGLGPGRGEAGDLDEYSICFQSRVGPLKWIGPYTDAEIVRCAEDGYAAVVVPVAFVSEHSETLVELDIEYRQLADEHECPAYVRVPTVDTHPAFIDGLAGLVRNALANAAPMASQTGGRLCGQGFACCALAGTA